MRVNYFLSILFLLAITKVATAAEKVEFIEPLLVTIPAGEFLMGSNDNPNEQPIHEVNIATFQLSKYEVTIAEFNQFERATHYARTGKCFIRDEAGDYEMPMSSSTEIDSSVFNANPMDCMSWDDAHAYITWLVRKTGKAYRLPSEAEWEYAARSGSDQKYFFGSDESKLCEFANIYGNENFGHYIGLKIARFPCSDQADFMSVVGMYKPNSFGLYDVIGNVNEWVEDCPHSNYEGAPSNGSAWKDRACTQHLARGGSWANNNETLGVSYRHLGEEAGKRTWVSGFRIALGVQSDAAKNTANSNHFVADLAAAQQLERSARDTKVMAVKQYLKNSKTWKLGKLIEPPMVTIPAGKFTMGSTTFDNKYHKASPIHEVNVQSFKISKYEVTVKQFKQFVAATGYFPSDSCWLLAPEKGGQFKIEYTSGNWLTPEYAPSDFHPVMCVSWDDAYAYMAWLTQQTGRHYRLPSEAEWEYAARGGSTTKYYFGDREEELCRYANFRDESAMIAFARDKGYEKQTAVCNDGAEYTSVVGMYKPNNFGLYDMIGNVSEWVEDCDHVNYEGAPNDGSAWASEACQMRSRRGGSYSSMPFESQITVRGHGGQTNHSSVGEGFRIVEDVTAGDPCNNILSSVCKKITQKKSQFEIDLEKVKTR